MSCGVWCTSKRQDWAVTQRSWGRDWPAHKLGVHVALLGALPPPLDGERIRLRDATPLLVHQAQLGLSLGVSGLGGTSVPAERRRVALLLNAAEPISVEVAQVHLQLSRRGIRGQGGA